MEENIQTPTPKRNELPEVLSPLVALPRWVIWRWEIVNGKRTKVPYQASHPDRKAKSTDPNTWSDYATAMDASKQADGIGFCLLNSEYGAFDLDDCRDVASGTIDPWAQELVKRAGSYTEITVSGTGLRIIGRATGPKIHRKQKVTNGSTLETYRGDAERYIVMTGNALAESPMVLADLDTIMETVVAELDSLKPEPQPAQQEAPRGGEEIFNKLSATLRKAIKAEPFEGEDTSETSASVIEQLQRRGYTDAEIIKLFESSPRGIGKRYANGKDLRADVERIRKKYGQEGSGKKSVGEAVLVKLGKPRAVRWLWKWHLKRGSIEITTGEPTLGKTQILCSIVATITAGKPWPNGDPAPNERKNVIMMVAEDALDDELTPRLIAAEADIDRVRVLKSIRKNENEEYFLISDHLVELENAIKKWGDVALVTIDPITSFLGTSGKIDSHKAQDVRSVLRGLQDILEREDIACSLITHPAKSAGAKPLDHFIGTQAFGAAPRVAHLVTEEMQVDEETGDRVPTGRKIYSVAKTNHKSPNSIAYRLEMKDIGVDEETGELIEASHVVWEEEIEITARQAIAAAAGVDPADWKKKREACANFLIMELSKGPKMADQIQKNAKALDFGRKVLDVACDKLGVVKKPGEFQGQWLWSLPTHGLI